jgi:hypothetical protein
MDIEQEEMDEILEESGVVPPVDKKGPTELLEDGSAPVYDYKHTKPWSPTLVYTRNEDEANELVLTLQGCVSFNVTLIVSEL